MKFYAKHITEPLLDFGDGYRHVDTKTGISLYGPYDYNQEQSIKQVKAGIIGTNRSIEGTLEWFERCRNPIPAKESRLSNIYQNFSGFNKDNSFRCELVASDSWHRYISNKTISDIEKLDHNDAIKCFVLVLVDELKTMLESYPLDLIICALPKNILESLTKSKKRESKPHNLRDRIKAAFLPFGKPSQIILPYTYNTQENGPRNRQDDATIAWNLSAAAYYKAGGTPWRLNITRSDIKTCFIGISFYRNANDSFLNTSMAQVFNQRGEGVVVRGASVRLSRRLRTPHLSRDQSFELLKSALDVYKKEHFHMPARIVLHKSSYYTDEEKEGFNSACDSLGIQIRDYLSIKYSDVKAFRHGDYPVLRGTTIKLSEEDFVLYTNGSIPYYKTYPGLYIPHPIQLRIAQADFTWEELASEILALSKMNWNNTNFGNNEPVTLEASRGVGYVLKHMDNTAYIPPQYRYYM